MRRALLVVTAALFLVGGSGSTAFGKQRHGEDGHSHNIEIGSTADGGGSLIMVWDFEAQPIARVVDSGFSGLFSGDIPGFAEAADDSPHVYELAVGTEVEIEVVAIDEGVSMKIGNSILDRPGDTAVLGTTTPELHNHPEYQLLTAGANTYGAGNLSFRVREGGSGKGYEASEVRTLTVSNGYLPVLETATAADLTCLKTVQKAAGKFSAKVEALMAKCFDSVLAHEYLEKSETAALKACDLNEADPKSLVGRIDGEKDKALAAIAKGCGALSGSSTPYTESMIQAQLGMTDCLAQEIVGARYNGAAEALGHILLSSGSGDEDDVSHAFPCMKASFE